MATKVFLGVGSNLNRENSLRFAVAKIGPKSLGVGRWILTAIKLPKTASGMKTNQCMPSRPCMAIAPSTTLASKSQITKKGTVITTLNRRMICITITTLGLTSSSSSAKSMVKVIPPGNMPMMQLLRPSWDSLAVTKARIRLAPKITTVASVTPRSSCKKLCQVSAVKVEPMP